MFNIAHAIDSLYPKAPYTIAEFKYETLVWMSANIPKPTEEELNAEIARLQAEYDSKQYQRDRAKEYPAVVDQLDTMYHGGYDAWKTQIQAVKDKYPKPV
jgi:hypothetical protein